MTNDTLIIERLTRVEEKIDGFMARALDQAIDQSSRLSDHETRIRAVEGNQSKQLGIMGTVSAVFAVAGAAVFERLF